MLIAQISDTHLTAEGAMRARRIDELARTVAHINALEPRPDVVVHTGDVAHDATEAEYRLAREILSDLEAPLFATVGNRDRRAPFAAAFAPDGYLASDTDFIQYAVDLGELRLVAADTLSDAAIGGFCAARAAQLEALLAQAPDTPTLVFLHHPPVPVETIPNPVQFDPEQGARLAALLSRHPQVLRVICGHVHRAANLDLAGVMATTMTSIATDLRKGQYPARLHETPVFQVHRSFGDLTVVSRSEIVRDQGTQAEIYSKARIFE